jgi:hypothetical protein
VAVGGALVVPAGLPARLRGERADAPDLFARETARVERLAMEAVMAAEERLGHEPRDVSREKRGYDIESRVPPTGGLRFIEVKGRVIGAETVTVTKNEILTALNKPDEFLLALVEINGDAARTPRYVRRPFTTEPDFGATSVNYNLAGLMARSEAALPESVAAAPAARSLAPAELPSDPPPSPASEYALHVDRAEFVAAMKRITGFKRNRKDGLLCLSFDGERLSLKLPNSEIRVSATGKWATAVSLPAAFAWPLSSVPPTQDPVPIAFANGRVKIGTTVINATSEK